MWINPYDKVDIKSDLRESGLTPKNIRIKRKPLPSGLLKKAEKKIHKMFIKHPYLYTYEPKKGKTFRKKKGLELRSTDWMGHNVMLSHKSKVTHGYVLIPKVIIKDKKLRDEVILHELKENAMLQHMISKKKKMSSYNMSNKVHKKAVRTDKWFGIGKEKRVDQKILSMFNDIKNWE